jgi:hypothetical protein
MQSHPRVVVIAGSIESIDALTRFIRQMPATFPVPIVAYLHGLQSRSVERLIEKRWRFASHPNIVHARDGDQLQAGRVHVIPAEENLVFVSVDTLGLAPGGTGLNADRLFASAAHWYQSEVIGIVLSGLGTDGTEGLRAITKVEGKRVVQSPNEAAFFSMPLSALRSNAVQHSVMLDELGKLIMSLVVELGPTEIMSAEMTHEIALQTLASEEDRTKSLDRSIIDILNVMRYEMDIDIVFVPNQATDGEIVDHWPASWHETSFHGVSHAGYQRLCQLAFNQRPSLAGSYSVVSKRRLDAPATLIAPEIYMAVPVWFQNGSLFGALCCLSPGVMPDLRRRHRHRLQISARQIARLIDEPGGL